MREQFAAAVQRGDENEIQRLLNAGFVPENLQEEIFVTDKSTSLRIRKNLIEILLSPKRFALYAKSFDTAQILFELGAPLPNAHRQRVIFSDTRSYLEYLCSNPHDLFIALNTYPEIINLQDEDKRTLLHHTVFVRHHDASLIFNHPKVDFSIQDKDGNTPVHLATLHCRDGLIGFHIFPYYLTAAKEQNFNFSTLNGQGLAVIHLAATRTYGNQWTGEQESIVDFLKRVPGSNLDVLSKSGSTALFEAIHQGKLHAANVLLDAGASPSRCGNPDKNPLIEINKVIALLAECYEQDREELKDFEYLRAKMEDKDIRIRMEQFRRNRNIGLVFTVMSLLTAPLGVGLLMLIPSVIALIVYQVKYNNSLKAAATTEFSEFNLEQESVSQQEVVSDVGDKAVMSETEVQPPKKVVGMSFGSRSYTGSLVALVQSQGAQPYRAQERTETHPETKLTFRP